VIREDTDTQDLYVGVVSNFRLSRAIWLAARFRLADAIGEGPAQVEEIARVTGTHAGYLRRLLKVLVSAGYFRSAGDGGYGPTAASDLLRSDHPKSQRGMIEVMLGGEIYAAWGSLEEAFRTGQPAFEISHGMSWIDYFASHEEAGMTFAEAMSGTTRAWESAILQADPFPPFSLAVDVGGSHGSLVRSLLEQNGEARGVVFDLPGVIASWQEQGYDDREGRVTGIGGDFFEAVPDGGDLYLLKFILHDWDDDRARIILRRVREAIRPDGHIALVETVLPDAPEPHPGWLMDLGMLTITGGRERTADDFTAMLEATGFRLVRIVPTGSPMSVIVAAPD
jgi:hypothetical protein